MNQARSRRKHKNRIFRLISTPKSTFENLTLDWHSLRSRDSRSRPKRWLRTIGVVVQ
jgi:hypothetical protein